MKIVTQEEFLREPAGTLYCKYSPCIFGELSIKYDTLFYAQMARDWIYQSLSGNIKDQDTEDRFNILEKAKENKTSVELDFDITEGDACYDKDQLFAVYEKEDLKAMINKLITLL